MGSMDATAIRRAYESSAGPAKVASLLASVLQSLALVCEALQPHRTVRTIAGSRRSVSLEARELEKIPIAAPEAVKQD